MTDNETPTAGEIIEAGRRVRKGSKALGILYPTVIKTDDDDGATDVYFKVGNVFDVTQTDPIDGAAAPAFKRIAPDAHAMVSPDRASVAAYVAEGLGETQDFAPSDSQ
jgi:hypothetical protein